MTGEHEDLERQELAGRSMWTKRDPSTDSFKDAKSRGGAFEDVRDKRYVDPYYAVAGIIFLALAATIFILFVVLG